MPNNQAQFCNTKDFTDPGWAVYELLDSGAFQKLERFGCRMKQKEKSAGRKFQRAFHAKLEEGIQ